MGAAWPQICTLAYLQFASHSGSGRMVKALASVIATGNLLGVNAAGACGLLPSAAMQRVQPAPAQLPPGSSSGMHTSQRTF